MNGINLKLGLGMLNQLLSLKIYIASERKEILLFSVHDPFRVKLLTRLTLQLVILMNINLDTVLVIQSILCVHAEMKLKLLCISSCVVTFRLLKD